jgi:exonuclease III
MTRASPVTVVGWNIRAGGGVRVAKIADAIGEWNTDLAALSEFRATPPSLELAARLADAGLCHRYTSASERDRARNAVLIASRFPLRRIRTRTPRDDAWRWLLAENQDELGFAIAVMHVPNRVTGRKWSFHDSVLGHARRWRRGPALFIGDTNTGIPGIDEESRAFNARERQWMEALEHAGWTDIYRRRYPAAREFSWYSPNGDNGFRLDQAFVNRALRKRILGVRYVWAGGHRKAGISDHAAIIVRIGGDTRGDGPA